MGFFSYTCAKTRIPFAAGPDANGGDPSLNRVVVLVEGEVPVEGAYDGFGRVRGVEGVRDLTSGRLCQMLSSGKAKVVLAKFHDPSDTLADLDKTRPDPGQGLHSTSFLHACHAALGFASHEAYILAWKGFAPPLACSSLGAGEAKAVLATATALAEAVSRARMEDMAASGTGFPAGDRIYPHHLTLRQADGRPGLWSPAPNVETAALMEQEVDPAFAAACSGISFAIDGKVPAKRGIAALARRLVDAMPVRTLHEVPLALDGEPVGHAASMACPMGARWYEVRLDGEPGRAWTHPNRVAEALGVGDGHAFREALWGVAPADEPFELSPASSPSP